MTVDRMGEKSFLDSHPTVIYLISRMYKEATNKNQRNNNKLNKWTNYLKRHFKGRATGQ